MKLFDRLSRGIRVFRVSADLRAVESELRGVRIALECICREAFGVELAPETPLQPVRGADRPYFEDGGIPDLDRVRRLLFDAGYKSPPAGTDPIPEGEETENEPSGDRNSPHRSNSPVASAAANVAWEDSDGDEDADD